MRNVQEKLVKIKRKKLKKKNKWRMGSIIYFPLPKCVPKKYGGKELIEKFVIPSFKAEIKTYPTNNHLKVNASKAEDGWYIFVMRPYSFQGKGVKCNYSQVEEAMKLAESYGINVVKTYPIRQEYTNTISFIINIPNE